ncbi:MAG TPA: copper resistance protein NlpE N-terminal domain-containing protein [Arenibacter sp.]|nr:copper resistance protein NlpE N-terminal domain-containing protein [Arenibacter sp.]
MNNLKIIIVLTGMALATISCKSKINKTNTEFEDHHTAQNSLDWSGTYSGILPCADCSGIETELTLNADNTFVLTTSYLGKQDSGKNILEGKFEWDRNEINLMGIRKGERPTTYKVEENRIRQLDMKGHIITGNLAQNYVLKKNGNLNVEDKRWKLVELNGKPIAGTAESHYLIFRSKDGKIEAKANCNIMLSNYTIKNELQLKIEQGLTTLMACPDNLEQEFGQVLTTVDNLSTDGKSLSLNKARMAPLARFELVE